MSGPDEDKNVSLENVESEKDADDDKLEPTELKEVVEVVTTAKLMTEVVTVAAATITAATTPITAAKITVAPSAARRRKEKRRIMVQEPKPLKKKTHIEQDEAYARELEMEEKDSRALKRTSESLEEKAAKKQMLDEEDAPLALNVPVVDYAIHTKNNKPYFKIIRDDGTHQLFLSFLSLLRNFDREDLEVLWQLVKERFASSKPKNFSDDFLLTTLTYMFKKPNVEAQVWKSQRGVYGLSKVKS
uniref:Uncharacterized protein n=1 Tax=Tanacetum cinerariifolium TaxID=118510 RepID=A0A699HKM3_TANCI|nr:hypothetical protein [Tanacetum cinerariifolium]